MIGSIQLCDVGQIICEKRSFKAKTRDFPCGPVVKNLLTQGAWVRSLVCDDYMLWSNKISLPQLLSLLLEPMFTTREAATVRRLCMPQRRMASLAPAQQGRPGTNKKQASLTSADLSEM